MTDGNALLTVEPENMPIASGGSSQHDEVANLQVPSPGDAGNSGIEEDDSMVIDAAYLERYETDADPDMFKRVRAKGVSDKS